MEGSAPSFNYSFGTDRGLNTGVNADPPSGAICNDKYTFNGLCLSRLNNYKCWSTNTEISVKLIIQTMQCGFFGCRLSETLDTLKSHSPTSLKSRQTPTDLVYAARQSAWSSLCHVHMCISKLQDGVKSAVTSVIIPSWEQKAAWQRAPSFAFTDLNLGHPNAWILCYQPMHPLCCILATPPKKG